MQLFPFFLEKVRRWLTIIVMESNFLLATTTFAMLFGKKKNIFLKILGYVSMDRAKKIDFPFSPLWRQLV